MLAVKILIAALLITRLSVGSGFRLGLVDHPDARKKHQGAIPLTGGVAVFITVLFGHLLLDIPPYSWEMLLLATIVFLVGLFDDIRHINPWVRLGIQYGAGVALATLT